MDLFQNTTTGAGNFIAAALIAQKAAGRSFHLSSLAQFIDDKLAEFNGGTPPPPAASTAKKPDSDAKAIPPSPADVTAYFAFIGYHIDGDDFCDSYAAKGWLVGKVKMKDWQAACRNWKRNNWGKLTRRAASAPQNSYTTI